MNSKDRFGNLYPIDRLISLIFLQILVFSVKPYRLHVYIINNNYKGIKWERAQRIIHLILLKIVTLDSFFSFHDCAFGNGRIDHFTDLPNYLLNIYCTN